jgi:hypothetical protein
MGVLDYNLMLMVVLRWPIGGVFWTDQPGILGDNRLWVLSWYFPVFVYSLFLTNCV